MDKVSMTVRQIMNLDLWDRVCEYKGWNPYILNEGLISEDEIVEFDDKFEKEEEVKLLTIDELIDLKDSYPYMDGDSWFVNNTPVLIDNLIHYVTRLNELEKDCKEELPDGDNAYDSAIILEAIEKIKGGKLK